MVIDIQDIIMYEDGKAWCPTSFFLASIMLPRRKLSEWTVVSNVLRSKTNYDILADISILIIAFLYRKTMIATLYSNASRKCILSHGGLEKG